MAIKFLKISSYYRDFLDYYYQQFPHIKNSDYQEQYAHLMGQYFSWSDNYGRLLAAKGLGAMEVVANALPMQKAWAIANGYSPLMTPGEILLKQIAHFQPQVIYFQDSITWNGTFIGNLRARFPSVRLCIGNLCAPFTSLQVEDFKAFDYFTVCSPFFQQQLGKFGIDTVLIPHAFDDRILTKISENNPYPASKFVFTGSIFPGEGFHTIRAQLLEELVQGNIPFLFYGNLPDKSRMGLLRKQASYVVSHWLDRYGLKKITDAVPVIRKGRNHATMPKPLRLSSELYKNARPPVFGLDMFKALSKAEIGFNIHGDCAGDYAANLRLYETTGVGTCLLTDHKSDLKNYFEPDVEVVTYKNARECIEKVRWLTAHPDECRKIAFNGQKRTLSDHHFTSRVDLFYDEMCRRIKNC